MKINIFFLSLLFLISCQSADNSFKNVPENVTMDQMEHLEKKESPTPTSVKNKKIETPENIAPRRIIKNANLRMQVENVDESSSKITLLTEEFKGFIAGMNLTNNNYEISNKIRVKIPANNFELFIHRLSKEALFIAQKNITTQDVTEEYVDLQSRLKTKKEVMKKYAEILRSKTKTVEEVLNAENMIRQLQEEIESAEGRLRYLSNQSSFSTIVVDIYEP